MLRPLLLLALLVATAGCLSSPQSAQSASPGPAAYLQPAPAPPPPVAHQTVQAALEPGMGLSCTDHADVRTVQHRASLEKGSEGLPFRFEAPKGASSARYSFQVTPYDGGEPLLTASVQPGQDLEGRMPHGPEPFSLTVWRCAADEGSFAFTTWEA